MAFRKSEKESGISYKVVKEYGSIGGSLQLKLISWNGGEPKYDIRSWYTDKNGVEKCGKGITLTGEQAEELMNLLNEIEKEEE